MTFNRRPRQRAALRAAALAALGLISLQALAAPLTLYVYRDKTGMPVYTNQKPENVEYVVIHPGSGEPRPVLSMPPPNVPAASNTDTSAVAVSIAAPVASSPAAPDAVVAPAEAATAATDSTSASEEVLIGWAASCKGVTQAMLDERAKQWLPLVNKHAKAHGVPVALVRAVMRVESCFDAHAVSRVGARGLMQLMPDTATQLGVRDSFDADQNIAGGVRYLRLLLERFKNNTRLAVAAYNAGPMAVDAYHGIPPFPETRSYVQRVLAEYRVHNSKQRKQSKS